MKQLVTLAFLWMVACAPPEPLQVTPQSKWFKGNLHTHSYWSDGDEFPEMIMQWYRRHGYQFVALSDHNKLAVGQQWIEVSPDSMFQKAFQEYLQSYGSDWVTFKKDSGITQVQLKTLEQYRPLFEVAGEFLIVQAEEITDHFEDKPLHLNATNVQYLIEPQGGTSVVDVLQRNINAVLHQRDSTGEPMMVHINHPNFHFAVTVEDMIALQGEQFFEVFNGHPLVYNFGDSSHIDTESMWDQINIAYLKQGKPPLYGLATDDSHNYHLQGKQWSNSGRGWIQVQADTLSLNSLLTAIEQGRFYASTGVTLQRVELENNVLTVEVLPEPGVEYEIQFIGCKKDDFETSVLQSTGGVTSGFMLDPSYLFVRAKIISGKAPDNPIENMDFQTAWTQPVQYVN